MSDPSENLVHANMEYLDAGPTGNEVLPDGAAPPRAKRRRPWVPVVIGLATFLVVLVGAGLVLADWAERNVEMRALVSSVESSEAAMSDVQAAISAMSVHFDPNTPLTDAERAAVDEKLKQIAAEGVLGVTDGGHGVAAVTILPWHKDILAAQQAYLAHNQSWQDYLSAAAKDPAEFAKPQDKVNETFSAAEKPMRDAVPRGALFDLRQRVDTIFAPPPSQDGGPTQQA
jgi:hypothetical protein